jgi:hypothetical protein
LALCESQSAEQGRSAFRSYFATPFYFLSPRQVSVYENLFLRGGSSAEFYAIGRLVVARFGAKSDGQAVPSIDGCNGHG